MNIPKHFIIILNIITKKLLKSKSIIIEDLYTIIEFIDAIRNVLNNNINAFL